MTKAIAEPARARQHGFSLIEILVGVAIMGIVGLGIAGMLSDMAISQAALQEKFTVLDASNQLARAFADQSICGAQLNFSPSLPANFTTTPLPTIHYNEIRMGLTNTAASPIIIKAGDPMPGYSNGKMIVQSIRLQNISSITGSRFSGDLEVVLNPATLRRPLKPFGVKGIIFTTTLPMTAASLAQCGGATEACKFCETCGGDWPNSVGQRRNNGDWGTWMMSGPLCAGPQIESWAEFHMCCR